MQKKKSTQPPSMCKKSHWIIKAGKRPLRSCSPSVKMPEFLKPGLYSSLLQEHPTCRDGSFLNHYISQVHNCMQKKTSHVRDLSKEVLVDCEPPWERWAQGEALTQPSTLFCTKAFLSKQSAMRWTLAWNSPWPPEGATVMAAMVNKLGASSIITLPCGSCSMCMRALLRHWPREKKHENHHSSAASWEGHCVTVQGKEPHLNMRKAREWFWCWDMLQQCWERCTALTERQGQGRVQAQACCKLARSKTSWIMILYSWHSR